eukprot:1945576-Rhodomonas_salina.5
MFAEGQTASTAGFGNEQRTLPSTLHPDSSKECESGAVETDLLEVLSHATLLRVGKRADRLGRFQIVFSERHGSS